MSKTIKTGRIGKHSAIEKMNRQNNNSSSFDAAGMMEQTVFQSEQEAARKRLDRRRQIIQDFSISFENRE